MTRFDAPAPSPSVSASALRATVGLAIAHVGMLAATLVLTTLAMIAATALVSSVFAVPAALQQAFVASPVLVFLSPTISRNDAEALRPGLMASPDVADATLRTKEDALGALVAAGLPAPPDGRNPLPDVWTVTLRGSGPSFMTEAVTARDALRALPAVDVVRFDEAWAGLLDRTAATWSRLGMTSVAGGLVATGLAVLCIYLLFGRTLTTPASAGAASFGALMIVGFALVGLSALIDYAACRILVTSMGVADGFTGKPIAVGIGLNLVKTVAEVAVAAFLLAASGIGIGRSR